MFGELIKLRELGKLARTGRHLEVLVLARDPAIRDHKKARDAVSDARSALLEEARLLQKDGRHEEALQRLRGLLRDGDDPQARQLEKELRDAAHHDERLRVQRDREFEAARSEVEAGDFGAAAERLKRLPGDDSEARRLQDELDRRRVSHEASLAELGKLVDRGELEEVLDRLDRDEPTELGSLLDRAMEKAIKRRELVIVARLLARSKRGRGALSTALRDRGAAFLLAQVEKQARRSEEGEWQRCLDLFPIGWSGDEEAMTLGKGLRRLRRARQSLHEGDLGLAQALAEEAERLFPRLHGAQVLKDQIRKFEGAAAPLLAEARREFALGQLQNARARVLSLLEEQPNHAEGRDLLHAIDERQRVDLEELAAAQGKLERGDPEGARELLVALQARRPDLSEVEILLQDAERRRREAKLRAIDDESCLLDRDLAFAPPSRAIPKPPATPQKRDPRPIPTGSPFILRVEERGDWFAHPGDSLVIGNSLGKVADLPVLAAIGSRHARLRRVREAPGVVRYFIEAAPKQRLLRNRRPLKTEEELCHGDVVDLGGILSFTFLRPVPDSESAVLKLDGRFGVHECRHVLLFAESGGRGRLVIGPGPEAHVPMGADRDRIEILRESEGKERLLARCPFGVAVDGGEQRPQVAVQSRQRVHSMDVDLFLDEIG